MGVGVPEAVSQSWPAPNYAHPVRRGPELYIISSFFLLLAVMAVGVRLYTRIMVRRWVGPDDGLVIIALMSAVGVMACVALGNTQYQWDRHTWDVEMSVIPASLKVIFIIRILWGSSLCLVRLSVLCLYYRLLDLCQGQRYRWVLHIITAGTVGLLLMFLFTGFLACIPMKAYWTLELKGTAQCVNDFQLMVAGAVSNTISEIIVASLPIFAVFKLHVAKNQRWTVITLFSMNFLVAIAGICRIYYLALTLTTWDLNWYANPQWICSLIEIDVALICACGPPLLPLARRFYVRFHARREGFRPHPSENSSTGISGVSSENKGDISIQQRGRLPDPEEIACWHQLTARVIDLEGIGDDGLGYTVTISAPKPKDENRRTFSERFRTGLLLPQNSNNHNDNNNLTPAATRTSATDKDPDGENDNDNKCNDHEDKPQPLGVEITTTRSVHLTESFRPVDMDWQGQEWSACHLSACRHNIRRDTAPADEMAIDRATENMLDWSLLENFAVPSSPSFPPPVITIDPTTATTDTTNPLPEANTQQPKSRQQSDTDLPFFGDGAPNNHSDTTQLTTPQSTAVRRGRQCSSSVLPSSTSSPSSSRRPSWLSSRFAWRPRVRPRATHAQQQPTAGVSAAALTLTQSSEPQAMGCEHQHERQEQQQQQQHEQEQQKQSPSQQKDSPETCSCGREA